MRPEDLVGTQIDRYQLEALIGTGGVAAVYRAVDTASGERLAIKVFFPPPGAGPELSERFRHEARTAARLDHPGILHIFDAGETDGQLFILMALVEGPSLQELLEARDRFDEATAAELAMQVAEALDSAHRQGVIHRDVKPSNILVDPQGRALLTDFGVARALDTPSLTATGYSVGTPIYMSPEQASGRPNLDGRADLYSLGVVLYQMVTGCPPFRGSTPQVMHAHVYEAPPPPSSVAEVSPTMEAIILRMLAKNPDERYPTGVALAADLHSLVEATRTRQPAAHPAHTSPHLWQGLAIRPTWVLTALLAIAVISGGVWLATDSSPLRPSQSLTSDVPIAAAPSPSSPTPAPSSPTPTSQALVGDLSSTPPVPPSPTPTPTASFTPSPSPTFTPTPSPPTSTPSPTPTPCPQPAATVFTGWLASDADLSAQVGCPRGQVIQTDGAWEPFERGQMLWRSDLRQIYILDQGGTWAVYDDKWREGDLEWDASFVPPAGLDQPVRGFGLVWREEPSVREALGWATAAEASFEASFQPFERALLIADEAAGRTWALLSDGTWRSSP